MPKGDPGNPRAPTLKHPHANPGVVHRGWWQISGTVGGVVCACVARQCLQHSVAVLQVLNEFRQPVCVQWATCECAVGNLRGCSGRQGVGGLFERLRRWGREIRWVYR